jgi:cob(I)alamin adenosyltransferase
MAVHLTRIYTRTGDDGSTTLGDLSRVPKTDPRIAVVGDCDETNAVLGVVLALGGLAEPITGVLRQVQNDLFDVGADFATPIVADPRHPPLRITAVYVERLEGWCDQFNAELAPLNSFILPGGTSSAALLHQARAVTRRAERSAWVLHHTDGERTNPLAVRYLNRLSDLLFILARVANPQGDVLWHPGGS